MHLLEVNNLTKRFGGLIAVNNVSFNINEGEIVGIIGPNGAGKTTLFNLISGFLKPTSGTVKFKDENITGLAPHKIVNKGIARTFQVVRPFRHLPVIANVMISMKSPRGARKIEWLKTHERKALDLLEDVGLSELMLEPAENVGHGDLKRLEMARALATEPDLLMLDEPFGGLNPLETDFLTKSILRMHLDEPSRGIVIVEHKLYALMKIAQRVVVLHQGEKIADGKPEEIAKNKRVIEVYMGKEM
ncbi:MAG: ABC transporter ATP-binding protein [Candidatus Bathyarchaeota archaeon]|nr:ABC transporter ATP-binding protein [Candidatus Bathyarchaeota archaeon]MDH5733475.1 ABC transporter ATP-binding protein [Candidatus Bathyarchaeota archaeon]